MGKKFVSVIAEFSENGKVKPLILKWEDGRRFSVDYVNDIRRAASLKGGGIGLRYDCSIHGKQVFLFKDDDQWFMEVDN